MVHREIKVSIVKAHGLAAMDSGGTSDPYIQVKFGNAVHKTAVKKKTLNPEYNETFNIKAEVPTNTVILTIEVFDWNLIQSHKPMGTAIYDMYGLKKGVATDVWVPLMVKISKTHTMVKGAVHLQITPLTFGADPSTEYKPKDYRPILTFLELTPAASAKEDIKNIEAKFQLIWDNLTFDLTTAQNVLQPAGRYVVECIGKYFDKCFAKNPAGVDKEGLKAAMVDSAHYYNSKIMAAPVVKDEHFEKVWNHFTKQNDLIVNMFGQFCDEQKLVIINEIKFNDAETAEIIKNFEAWKTQYAPVENKFLPLLDLFAIEPGTEIFEDAINLREKFNSKPSVNRILIRLLFESYMKPGKHSLTQAEFTEFMQTAIPVFGLEKTFQADDASIAKLFKEVDKDNSGSIDQFEFLYWFDLKASLELVTANNELMDAIKRLDLRCKQSLKSLKSL